MDFFDIPYRQHLNEESIADSSLPFVEQFSKQWLKLNYLSPNDFKTRFLMESQLEKLDISMKTFDILSENLDFHKLRKITIYDIDDMKYLELLTISPNVEEVVLSFNEFRKGLTTAINKILDFKRLKYLRIWCLYYGNAFDVNGVLSLKKKALTKGIEFICLNDYILYNSSKI